MNWKEKRYSEIKDVKIMEINKTYRMVTNYEKTYFFTLRKITNERAYFDYNEEGSNLSGTIDYSIDGANKLLFNKEWKLFPF